MSVPVIVTQYFQAKNIQKFLALSLPEYVRVYARGIESVRMRVCMCMCVSVRERETCQHVKCQADNLLEVAKSLAEG